MLFFILISLLGLQPCLGVGIKSAKELSDKWNIPLIAINHLEAHALISRLPSDGEYQEVTFPFLLLLVSGGHTQLIKADDVGNYSIIGVRFIKRMYLYIVLIIFTDNIR